MFSNDATFTELANDPAVVGGATAGANHTNNAIANTNVGTSQVMLYPGGVSVFCHNPMFPSQEALIAFLQDAGVSVEDNGILGLGKWADLAAALILGGLATYILLK